MGTRRKKVILKKIENDNESDNMLMGDFIPDEQAPKPLKKDRVKFEKLLKFIKENFNQISKEFSEEEKELLKMHWGIDMPLMTFSEIAEIKHLDENILRPRIKDLEKRFFSKAKEYKLIW
ncbi:hypothetical protein [Thermoanaerobacterium sp. RBIITD]|uniref:hypothetical protein n=1 Tax=Thermoanaerobacterium sp. RBIITD TaxID=1550240 RepID=UPI000BC0811B|nr:hypothetical protein [Thermoanaerobacterium sp. RBIITD]SNX53690.1 hypothetical protein SAMN05660242_1258 [Thermoanaerobacterium sp. RBIITD]